jgi:murein DD-endopeptidase MepM/ murein hydrolase activator NlpD
VLRRTSRVVFIGLILGTLATAAVYIGRTPHDRYALTLRIFHPSAVPGWSASAITYDVHLRRGQKYVAAIPAGGHVFLDLFRRTATSNTHVVSAPADGTLLEVETPADGDYVLRVHPALDHSGPSDVSQRVEPSLAIPVEGAKPASIQSGFGAPRDSGARMHQGVDIFAPRGTPVVAAADGLITSVGVNGLGGNVVWVFRPMRGESLYYAHLETQVVKAGSYVSRGDVLGTVGNTGNARGGPTHLHFGIYARGGAVDPLPYLVPAPEAQGAKAGYRRRLRKSPS